MATKRSTLLACLVLLFTVASLPPLIDGYVQHVQNNDVTKIYLNDNWPRDIEEMYFGHSHDFVVDMWVRNVMGTSISSSMWHRLTLFDHSCSSAGSGIDAYIEDNLWSLAVCQDSGCGMQHQLTSYSSAGVLFQDGYWHRVTFIVSGRRHYMGIMFDGNIIAEQTGSSWTDGPFFGYQSCPFHIGNQEGGDSGVEGWAFDRVLIGWGGHVDPIDWERPTIPGAPLPRNIRVAAMLNPQMTNADGELEDCFGNNMVAENVGDQSLLGFNDDIFSTPPYETAGFDDPYYLYFDGTFIATSPHTVYAPIDHFDGIIGAVWVSMGPPAFNTGESKMAIISFWDSGCESFEVYVNDMHEVCLLHWTRDANSNDFEQTICGQPSLASGADLFNGDWHLISWSIAPGSGGMSHTTSIASAAILVDGIPAASDKLTSSDDWGTMTGGRGQTCQGQLSIGGRASPPPDHIWFQGAIDELIILKGAASVSDLSMGDFHPFGGAFGTFPRSSRQYEGLSYSARLQRNSYTEWLYIPFSSVDMNSVQTGGNKQSQGYPSTLYFGQFEQFTFSTAIDTNLHNGGGVFGAYPMSPLNDCSVFLTTSNEHMDYVIDENYVLALGYTEPRSKSGQAGLAEYMPPNNAMQYSEYMSMGLWVYIDPMDYIEAMGQFPPANGVTILSFGDEYTTTAALAIDTSGNLCASAWSSGMESKICTTQPPPTGEWFALAMSACSQCGSSIWEGGDFGTYSEETFPIDAGNGMNLFINGEVVAFDTNQLMMGMDNSYNNKLVIGYKVGDYANSVSSYPSDDDFFIGRVDSVWYMNRNMGSAGATNMMHYGHSHDAEMHMNSPYDSLVNAWGLDRWPVHIWIPFDRISKGGGTTPSREWSGYGRNNADTSWISDAMIIKDNGPLTKLGLPPSDIGHAGMAHLDGSINPFGIRVYTPQNSFENWISVDWTFEIMLKFDGGWPQANAYIWGIECPVPANDNDNLDFVWQAGIQGRRGGFVETVVPQADIPIGEWFWFTFTMNDMNQHWKAYLNGDLVYDCMVEGTCMNLPLYEVNVHQDCGFNPAPSSLVIGKNANFPSYNKQMGRVRMWQTELDASAVKERMIYWTPEAATSSYYQLAFELALNEGNGTLLETRPERQRVDSLTHSQFAILDEPNAWVRSGTDKYPQLDNGMSCLLLTGTPIWIDGAELGSNPSSVLAGVSDPVDWYGSQNSGLWGYIETMDLTISTQCEFTLEMDLVIDVNQGSRQLFSQSNVFQVDYGYDQLCFANSWAGISACADVGGLWDYGWDPENMHHFAFVMTQSPGSVEIYVDGSMAAFSSGSDLTYGCGFATISWNGASGYGFDNMRLWDRALNPSELASVAGMRQAPAALEQYLFGLWAFDGLISIGGGSSLTIVPDETGLADPNDALIYFNDNMWYDNSATAGGGVLHNPADATNIQSSLAGFKEGDTAYVYLYAIDADELYEVVRNDYYFMNTTVTSILPSTVGETISLAYQGGPLTIGSTWNAWEYLSPGTNPWIEIKTDCAICDFTATITLTAMDDCGDETDLVFSFFVEGVNSPPYVDTTNTITTFGDEDPLIDITIEDEDLAPGDELEVVLELSVTSGDCNPTLYYADIANAGLSSYGTSWVTGFSTIPQGFVGSIAAANTVLGALDMSTDPGEDCTVTLTIDVDDGNVGGTETVVHTINVLGATDVYRTDVSGLSSSTPLEASSGSVASLTMYDGLGQLRRLSIGTTVSIAVEAPDNTVSNPTAVWVGDGVMEFTWDSRLAGNHTFSYIVNGIAWDSDWGSVIGTQEVVHAPVDAENSALVGNMSSLWTSADDILEVAITPFDEFGNLVTNLAVSDYAVSWMDVTQNPASLNSQNWAGPDNDPSAGADQAKVWLYIHATQAGNWRIEITIAGNNVFGPGNAWFISVSEGEVSLPSCSWGNNMIQYIAGDERQDHVYLQDSWGNPIDGAMFTTMYAAWIRTESPSGVVVDTLGNDDGNSGYDFAVQLTEAGEYNTSLWFNLNDMVIDYNGAIQYTYNGVIPYQVNEVLPGPVDTTFTYTAILPEAVFNGAESSYTGVPLAAVVQRRDAWGNNITAWDPVLDPQALVVTVTDATGLVIETLSIDYDYSTGLGNFTYVPQQGGLSVFNIRLNGAHVGVSPWTWSVEAGMPDAAQSSLELVATLVSGSDVVAQVASLSAETRDAYGNALTSEEPGFGYRSTLERWNDTLGSYEQVGSAVQLGPYAGDAVPVTIAGAYRLSLEIDTGSGYVHVSNSPYMFNSVAGDPYVPNHEVTASLVSNDLVAGSTAVVSVLPRDIYGNTVAGDSGLLLEVTDFFDTPDPKANVTYLGRADAESPAIWHVSYPEPATVKVACTHNGETVNGFPVSPLNVVPGATTAETSWFKGNISEPEVAGPNNAILVARDQLGYQRSDWDDTFYVRYKHADDAGWTAAIVTTSVELGEYDVSLSALTAGTWEIQATLNDPSFTSSFLGGVPSSFVEVYAGPVGTASTWGGDGLVEAVVGAVAPVTIRAEDDYGNPVVGASLVVELQDPVTNTPEPGSTTTWAEVGGGEYNLTFALGYNQGSGGTFKLVVEVNGYPMPDSPRTVDIKALCPAGLWSDGVTGPCIECAVNTYSSNATWFPATCQDCPENTIGELTGSDDVTDCLCAADLYGPAGGPCVDCPIGAECPGGLEEPRAQPGYWQSDTGNGIFYSCVPASACPGGDNADAGCAAGYAGRLCGSCDTGFYRLSEECVACPDDSGLMLILMMGVGLVFIMGLMMFGGSSGMNATTLSIGLNFSQVVALFGNFQLNWPQQVLDVFALLSSVNLNIDFASPECSIALTYWSKLQLKLGLPLALTFGFFPVALILLTCFKYCFLKCKSRGNKPGKYGNPLEDDGNGDGHGGAQGYAFQAPESKPVAQKAPRSLAESKKTEGLNSSKLLAGYIVGENVTLGRVFRIERRRAQNALLRLWIILYTSVAAASLEIFRCTEQADGTYSLDAEASIVCYDEDWGAFFPLALVAVILYALGIPLLVAYYLYKNRTRITEQKFLDKAGSSFAHYHPQWYYWETVVMARKLAVLLAMTFVSTHVLFKAVAGITTMFVFLLLQVFARPYKMSRVNRMEFFALCSSLICMFSGLLFYSAKLPDQESEAFVVYFLIGTIFMNLVFLVVMSLVDVKDIMARLTKKKAKVAPLERRPSMTEFYAEQVSLLTSNVSGMTPAEKEVLRQFHEQLQAVREGRSMPPLAQPVVQPMQMQPGGFWGGQGPPPPMVMGSSTPGPWSSGPPGLSPAGTPRSNAALLSRAQGGGGTPMQAPRSPRYSVPGGQGRGAQAGLDVPVTMPRRASSKSSKSHNGR